MHIINQQEIEKLIEIMRSKLDESNSIIIEDEGLSAILKYCLFLQQYALDIVTNSSFTYEDILYSEYYWFANFKNMYFSKAGYDAGIEQQEFLLMEKLSYELDGEIEWDFIEKLCRIE
ncbi:hypothetical protein [Neobacillus kokaensis]|uniref:Uncharacterized protein n=1 Tax=Neobacillus kokaensis TaxID=2759023 RepID=A0ABQ3N7F3_9BACI|nr:hypothetical protein [Neobacillus kokaensis]GHH99913.1 hypothetical protein AM1BK_34560 [Neobacillus kokaensis]